MLVLTLIVKKMSDLFPSSLVSLFYFIKLLFCFVFFFLGGGGSSTVPISHIEESILIFDMPVGACGILQDENHWSFTNTFKDYTFL